MMLVNVADISDEEIDLRRYYILKPVGFLGLDFRFVVSLQLN